MKNITIEVIWRIANTAAYIIKVVVMVIPFRIENNKIYLVYNEPNQYKPEKKKIFS